MSAEGWFETAPEAAARAAIALAAAPGVALDHAPLTPFMDPRTAGAPGVGPLDPADWLVAAADHDAQMAARDALIAAMPDRVLAHDPAADAAAQELLELVIAHQSARGRLRAQGGAARRADGVRVPLEQGPPIAVAARLAQEDFVILDRPAGAAEHVLLSAAVCFPAHWTLAEKFRRPLVRIHRPVPGYEGELARRVQRLFEGVRAGRPLVRANWNFQSERALWTPVSEAEKMAAASGPCAPRAPERWLRVERQTILRLARSGAVVFAIRTFLSPIEALTPAQRRGLGRALPALSEEERAAKAGPALRAWAQAAEGSAPG
ncbi:heme-dependent oxidative N-demethylase family protein [Oceanicella actignis]|uniref:DUF3445 domain-containing protein n=1 Tax=Oceanicella actignis TaxID=1189325 RepID=A0A1M7RWY4_9RHOB|nr:DUF3445 domain-containing protein [Oceanicella actignis]SES99405.1 Protein of unknown function [Oceanicella actignis]SHN50686.1 Protein of unknown function [Oceanicella actignis]